MTRSWIFVLPNALACPVLTLNGVVKEAPPCLSWMLGLPIRRAAELITDRGGFVGRYRTPADPSQESYK